MQRRTLLKSIIALPFLISGVQAKAHTASNLHPTLLLKTNVAGFQYYEGEQVWPHLTTGSKLTLLRESSNLYDENAISLYWQNVKLGYIPRSHNTVLANLMDQGRQLQAHISRTKPSPNPWERVQVKVALINEMKR